MAATEVLFEQGKENQLESPIKRLKEVRYRGQDHRSFTYFSLAIPSLQNYYQGREKYFKCIRGLLRDLFNQEAIVHLLEIEKIFRERENSLTFVHRHLLQCLQARDNDATRENLLDTVKGIHKRFEDHLVGFRHLILELYEYDLGPAMLRIRGELYKEHEENVKDSHRRLLMLYQYCTAKDDLGDSLEVIHNERDKCLQELHCRLLDLHRQESQHASLAARREYCKDEIGPSGFLGDPRMTRKWKGLRYRTTLMSLEQCYSVSEAEELGSVLLELCDQDGTANSSIRSTMDALRSSKGDGIENKARFSEWNFKSVRPRSALDANHLSVEAAEPAPLDDESEITLGNSEQLASARDLLLTSVGSNPAIDTDLMSVKTMKLALLDEKLQITPDDNERLTLFQNSLPELTRPDSAVDAPNVLFEALQPGPPDDKPQNEPGKVERSAPIQDSDSDSVGSSFSLEAGYADPDSVQAALFNNKVPWIPTSAVDERPLDFTTSISKPDRGSRAAPARSLVRRAKLHLHSALTRLVSRAIGISQSAVPFWEPALEEGKVRVRWTCRCGRQLYDDFQEIRPGAAKELAELLDHSDARLGLRAGFENPDYSSKPAGGSGDRRHTRLSDRSVQLVAAVAPASTPSSAAGQRIERTSGMLTGEPASAGSGEGPSTRQPDAQKEELKVQKESSPDVSTESVNQEPLFLLACISIGRYATSLLQLDLKKPAPIVSDRQLLELLRSRYSQLRSSWRRRLLSFQTLTSIEFVQFELHRKSLVDIRKRDDIPPAEREREYRYSPVPAEVIPPVGKNFLMHIYHHPEDVDQETVCLARFPKRVKERLKLGDRDVPVGWGIEFVEGVYWNKVWCSGFIIVALSLVTGIVWSCTNKDVQGGFGIAGYMMAFLTFTLGMVQATNA